jgi:hypothetical protein
MDIIVNKKKHENETSLSTGLFQQQRHRDAAPASVSGGLSDPQFELRM